MTTLTKAVRRTIADRDLVVEMTPQGIRMREKGRRTWFGPYGWGGLYLLLVRAEVDARKAAKRAARKSRRAR